MKYRITTLSTIVVLALASIAFAQVRATERGSAEAFRRIDAQARKAALERAAKGRYYDALKAFWNNQKFDPSSEPSREYGRLAVKFRELMARQTKEAAAEAEEKLFVYRRGRVRRNQEQPIKESGSRVYFNHAKAKDEHIEKQEAIHERLQKQLDGLASKKMTHLPVSWMAVEQGTVFYAELRGTVVQVLDSQNALIEKRLPNGGRPMFWVTGISTAGMVTGNASGLEGIFLVDGTKTYDTAVGTNTAKVLRKLDIDTSKFYPLPD